LQTKKTMKRLKFNIDKPLILIIASFVIFYVVISIVPHYTFNTNAFDLGIFNQALNSYSNFEIGPNTLRNVPTLFADHFEPIMLLFVPLYWVFGTYTLLLIQIPFIILGGIGVYYYIRKISKGGRVLGILAMLIFFLHYGVIQALAFDYHNNVVATSLIPWLFFFISEKKSNFITYFLLYSYFLKKTWLL